MVNRFWDKKNRYTEGFLKEYNHWVLEVSYLQHTIGCYIIFAKRPLERISQLKSEETTELVNVMGKIESALTKVEQLKPDRFNYLQLGNHLHHLHFHGIPRYKSPRKFNSKEWVDKTWGHPPILSKEEVGEELVKKIRDTLRPHL